MSSTSSPATSWILQQQSGNHQQRRNSGVPVIEPLNLWPTSSNWSNYNISEKYPSRSSPLTPTTPTCSPLIFSPTSSAAAAAAFAAGIVSASQHHPPPDSPHSVVDGYMDFPTTVAPLLMDYCPTNNNNNNNRKRPQPEGMPGIISQNKRSKSFTIDAILGLEDFPSSSYRSSTIEDEVFAEHHHQQRMSASSPESSSESSAASPHSSSSAMMSAIPSNGTPMTSTMSIGLSSSSPRAKRVRTIFSAEQLERLEAEFARQQYMVGPERLVLAASLRLSESQVKVWFQNRRIKWRKQHLEAQQMRLVTWRQHEEQQQRHSLMMNDEDDGQHSADSLSD